MQKPVPICRGIGVVDPAPWMVMFFRDLIDSSGNNGAVVRTTLVPSGGAFKH